MIYIIEQDVLNRIQQLLEFKHWTLYKLAKESNLAYSSLNNILNSETKQKKEKKKKICKGFNISLSEFFSFDTNPLRDESLTFEQQDVLNSYNELSSQDKMLLQAYLKGLRKK